MNRFEIAGHFQQAVLVHTALHSVLPAAIGVKGLWAALVGLSGLVGNARMPWFSAFSAGLKTWLSGLRPSMGGLNELLSASGVGSRLGSRRVLWLAQCLVNEADRDGGGGRN